MSAASDTPYLDPRAAGAPSTGLLLPDPSLRAEAPVLGAPSVDVGSGCPDQAGDDPLPHIVAAPNPLLEAARTLLRSLTELPSLPLAEYSADADSSLDRLHQTLVRDMRCFLSLCSRAGLRREHVVTAGYCLCTAIDEAVNKALAGRGESWDMRGSQPDSMSTRESGMQADSGHNVQTDGRGSWSSGSSSSGRWSGRSLLLLFHNETHGGEKFFLLLGHMVQTPREHLHVLELLYRLLCLGFEGRYALSVDGSRRLETIRRKLLSVLMEHTDPVPRDLSPHWKGLSGGRLALMRTVPVWVTASVLGIVLTGLFMSARADLEPLTASTVRAIRQLAAQPEALPPVPRWKDELPLELWFTEAEMRRYGLSVDIPNHILRLPGSLTFTNGVQLNPQVRPILDIIAKRLKETARPVMLLGHTDDTPLRTGSIFKDNQHLSEERARTVAQELATRGVAPERMQTSGRSDTQPLGSNATASGRTLNRRVELVLLPQPDPQAEPQAVPQVEVQP